LNNLSGFWGRIAAPSLRYDDSIASPSFVAQAVEQNL
jgi:hypothetical protein